MSDTVQPPQPEKELLEFTCLRFPDVVERTLSTIGEHEMISLRDIFDPLFARSDNDLLNTPALPKQVQINMTAFLLRRQFTLREAEADDVEMRQVIMSLAQECTPFAYRGRRPE